MKKYEGWEEYYQDDEKASMWKEESDKFLLENLESLLSLTVAPKVLDVACGDGRNTMVFRDKNCTMCCVDISETALKKVEKKWENPVLLCQDFTETSLLKGQFDIIICFDGLAQMEHPKKVIDKLCDMARQGGKVVFNYYTSGDCAYGEGERVDEHTYYYKNTIFKFMTMEELIALLPNSVLIEKQEVRRWIDPPHGIFRPIEHTHEANYLILVKNNCEC